MKNLFIGFGSGIIIILALYFFEYKPALQKEYKRGLAECLKDTDTIKVPGKPFIDYRDTSFHKTKPAVTIESDSLLNITSNFDTVFVSGKDTLTTKSKIKIRVIKKQGAWDIINPIAEWLQDFSHKDYQQLPDTITIYTPKYIDVSIKETNWLITGLSYILGIVTAWLLIN